MPSSRMKKRKRKEGNPRNWRDDFRHVKERFEYGKEKRKEEEKQTRKWRKKSKSEKARDSQI